MERQTAACSRTNQSGCQSHKLNVGQWERMASVATGGALAVYGLSRLSLKGLGMAALGGGLIYRGTTGHCQLYEATGIDTAHHNSAIGVMAGHGVRVERSIAINRPRNEVFQQWANIAQLPQWMSHLESVEPVGEGRSRWVAQGPWGARVSWEAEEINRRDGELLAWRSIEGSQVATAGSVHFRDDPHGGTVIHIELKYDPPAGKLGANIARLLGGDFGSRLDEDLRSFKALMESGEIPTTRGQSSGREMTHDPHGTAAI